MKIRKEQMEAFSKSRKDAYVALMVEHLRTDFSNELEAQNLAEEDLEPFVREGIADAEQYGLVYEDDVARYLECRALLGPKFDRDKKLPWAREIL